jgi:hypothetical protein
MRQLPIDLVSAGAAILHLLKVINLLIFSLESMVLNVLVICWQVDSMSLDSTIE